MKLSKHVQSHSSAVFQDDKCPNAKYERYHLPNRSTRSATPDGMTRPIYFVHDLQVFERTSYFDNPKFSPDDHQHRKSNMVCHRRDSNQRSWLPFHGHQVWNSPRSILIATLSPFDPMMRSQMCCYPLDWTQFAWHNVNDLRIHADWPTFSPNSIILSTYHHCWSKSMAASDARQCNAHNRNALQMNAPSPTCCNWKHESNRNLINKINIRLVCTLRF